LVLSSALLEITSLKYSPLRCLKLSISFVHIITLKKICWTITKLIKYFVKSQCFISWGHISVALIINSVWIFLVPIFIFYSDTVCLFNTKIMRHNFSIFHFWLFMIETGYVYTDIYEQAILKVGHAMYTNLRKDYSISRIWKIFWCDEIGNTLMQVNTYPVFIFEYEKKVSEGKPPLED
jgi:hypothetical protein